VDFDQESPFEDSNKACKPYVDASSATAASPYWTKAVELIESVDADIVTRDAKECTCGEGFLCQDTTGAADSGFSKSLGAGRCPDGHSKGNKSVTPADRALLPPAVDSGCLLLRLSD
jgi:hypothetical protein